MEKILEQFFVGELTLPEAIEAINSHFATQEVASTEGGDPEVRAVKTEAGWSIALRNWTGVSMAQMEIMNFEVLKAHQQYRATGLHNHRKQELAKHV